MRNGPILNISPPIDLRPRTKFIPEIGEECINMDGVIAVMKATNTPEAKAMYRAFRKRHAEIRLAHPDMEAVKAREEAVLAAIGDCGHRVKFTPVSGTMDGPS